MDLVYEHFGELIVGLVLFVFGWGFNSWSKALQKTSREFATMVVEFQRFRLESEKRLTRIETQLDTITRRVNGGTR